LIIHEALYFGADMDHSLIHSVPTTSLLGIDIDENERLPFNSQGSTVFFTSQYPTDEELDLYPHVVVTCDTPWDLHALIMHGGLDDTGHPTDDRFIQRVQSDTSHGLNRHHHMYETNCVLMFVDGNTEQLLMEWMINSVNVATVQHLDKVQSRSRHLQFEPEHVEISMSV
jgi:hypothetical protein